MQNVKGFQLLQKIGEGATSIVFKAVQTSMGRNVAVKILRPELAKNFEIQQRFVSEAKAVAKLSHRNIIKGINVGRTANNLIYFVMEYVDGDTGLQLIRKNKKLPEKQVISITKQMALALEHAHKHKMLHKDIKPENIMVTKTGCAKLCDLGLAAAQLDGSKITGTPYYISPEQARGEADIDIRSDIYSLGITAYHFATGKVPFGGTPTVVMSKHLTQKVRHPKDLVPELSDSLCNIIMKMVKKDPDGRYQNPTQLAAALTKLR
ncbi:serine/threonine-protein kinase [Candidatus Uabimicrobium amorphum]|uniref:Protein kinase n=1 Tax=Uabimicrobium amorphum TaxID=2596890 RepID=A0A5S9IJZ9_UABAM|nr:serine/threonine-protein kinase [Candidatus Uabimicrobium amorphum]BBM83114.1 protein kinase [Candidatus Uabimicrobium amorphum]